MSWKLTDDSSMQHVRSLEGCKLWQLIEIGICGEDKYEVYEDSINVDYYINELKEELLSIIKSFGYESVQQIIHEYKGDYEAYQIIAECIFEHYGSFQANVLFSGAENDCIEFVKNYIKETNIIYYRADYDNDTESEYFTAKTDEEAIEIAKSMNTVEYADIGTVKRNLIQLFEVDDNTECLDEVRMVWY